MGSENQALDECVKIIRLHDRSQYLLHLFTGKDNRSALASLLAFSCEIARVKESVSDPQIGRIRLEWWREGLRESFKGLVGRHQVLTAMARHLNFDEEFNKELNLLIDARERELTHTFFDHVDDLDKYLDETAVRLFRLIVKVLNINAHRTVIAAASKVGRAYGLAGLLAAVPHHQKLGQSYIPRILLEEAGVKFHDLGRTNVIEGLGSVIQKLAISAKQEISNSEVLIRCLKPDCKPILLAIVIIENQLKYLKKNAYNPYIRTSQIAHINLPLWLAYRAFLYRVI